MTNGQIYRGTFRFSVMRIVCTLVGLIVLFGLPVLAFLLTQNSPSLATGVIIGAFIVGCVAYFLIARYAGYLFTAGQIAMMEHGISEGSLPDDPYQAGKAEVKARFATASIYFGLKSITDGISREVTKGIDGITSALDGKENGALGTIGAVISTVISLVLEYVNYCSLAWVFHKKDQNAFKSTLDGAVIYFQNWKTLLKNLGKILLITLASLVVICLPLIIGAIFLFESMNGMVSLCASLDVAFELDNGTMLYGAAIVSALLLWSGIHSTLIKPYILVSVMRRYIEAGEENPPKVDLYEKLAGISKSFKKALGKADVQQPVEAPAEG